MNASEKLDALREVRAEITRLNTAAGHTVFNPAATELLQAVMDDLLRTKTLVEGL